MVNLTSAFNHPVINMHERGEVAMGWTLLEPREQWELCALLRGTPARHLPSSQQLLEAFIIEDGENLSETLPGCSGCCGLSSPPPLIG